MCACLQERGQNRTTARGRRTTRDKVWPSTRTAQESDVASSSQHGQRAARGSCPLLAPKKRVGNYRPFRSRLLARLPLSVARCPPTKMHSAAAERRKSQRHLTHKVTLTAKVDALLCCAVLCCTVRCLPRRCSWPCIGGRSRTSNRNELGVLTSLCCTVCLTVAAARVFVCTVRVCTCACLCRQAFIWILHSVTLLVDQKLFLRHYYTPIRFTRPSLSLTHTHGHIQYTRGVRRGRREEQRDPLHSATEVQAQEIPR